VGGRTSTPFWGLAWSLVLLHGAKLFFAIAPPGVVHAETFVWLS